MARINSPDRPLDAIRAIPDMIDGGVPPYIVDAMRHLLDVVGRMRAELKEHEWTAQGLGDVHYCPRCKNGPTAGHAPDCSRDALLRETR